MPEKYKLHIPTLLSEKLGISRYVGQAICAEAVLALDDVPIPIKSRQDRFWLTLTEEDWGKKLTVTGRTNTYVVEVTKEEAEYDEFGRK